MHANWAPFQCKDRHSRYTESPLWRKECKHHGQQSWKTNFIVWVRLIGRWHITLNYHHCPCCLPKALMKLGERFKDAYELLNLKALRYSSANTIHTFQCMGKLICVEFQRVPLKFHTKYLIHTLKDAIFTQHWNFKSFYIQELIKVFETPPWPHSGDFGTTFSEMSESPLSCRNDTTVGFPGIDVHILRKYTLGLFIT